MSHDAMPPGPPPGPPSGPPPGPSQGGLPRGYGAINLTLQGNHMTTSMLAPKVTFNKQPIPASFGTTLIPAPVGRHKVEVSAQWMRTYGQAELDVDVAEGQVVPVYYAMPYHQFTRGAIGHEKQKRPGVGGLIAILAVILVPLLLCTIGLIFL